jgi:MSHA biogenesis protein MshE
MRLLDQSGGVVSLDKVGMPADILRRFRAQIKAPHGLVLVTGPTGSGKTTSLYGALRELNTSEKKIITVEDPVEYQLPRVSQVQINDKIGLNFAKVLKATLRQDPDVLLIGEIRDQETAEIALRASMTGHLVLSTLHTNDAISSTMRLIEVGVEGYTVAGALRAVIAQRLVRRICDSCTEPYDPDPQEKAWLVGVMGPAALSSGYKKGRGCNQCNNTGYKGRVGVFELLEMDQNLADILRKEDTVEFARAARNMPNFKTLAECALEYAKQGITSVEEVQRVSEHVAEVEQVAPTSGTGEL